MGMRDRVTSVVPGLLLVAAVGAVALWLNRFYKPASAVAIALVIGLVTRNLLRVPVACRAGISLSVKRVLRLGIILLGAKLSFLEVVRTGGGALLIIVTCIVTAILLVHVLSRLLHLPSKLGTLIGVGSSICGNSAIVATAPVIDADDEEVSFAVATITLFGVLAVVVYPTIGHLLTLSETTFGTWAGTAVNDTSQVLAAGFIYGDDAGNVATVVKLTRNLFMAPVIVILGLLYHRRRDNPADTGRIDYRKTFPLFVLGFLAMAVLNTLGVFSPGVVRVLKHTSGFLIVTAIAGVGMSTSFASMKKLGLKPFYVGLAASIIMGGVSLVLISLVGTG